MNRTLFLCFALVFTFGVVAGVSATTPKAEIAGISLGMSRVDVRARLQSLGTMEKETRKRQEVWAIKDERISHLLVGYDPDMRVRYVTAIARTGGPRIRYDEVGELKSAERVQNQGNYKLTWQVAARSGHAAYLLIAHGHDPQFLDSYSNQETLSHKKAQDKNGLILCLLFPLCAFWWLWFWGGMSGSNRRPPDPQSGALTY